MRQERGELKDFKLILKEELASRCRQNPRYSLRAFARDLKIAPSRLSEILNGKQGLSFQAARAVVKALGYGPEESQRFCDLVASRHARSPKERDAAKQRLKDAAGPVALQEIRLDAFQAIADWYHFGILELTHVAGFQSDPRWIAKRLRISEVEAEVAIDRLVRLGLLIRQGDELKLTHDHGVVPDDIPSDSIKKFHDQVMARAKEALYTQHVDKREFRSEILAIDPAKLPEAKKALRDFVHRFCTDIGEADVKASLYGLSIQFFELTDKTT